MPAPHATRVASFITAAGTLLALDSGAANAIPPRGPDPYDHDKGFLMRLSGGFGYGNFSRKDGNNESSLSGVSAQLDLAFGGVITPGLALCGELFGMNAFSPSFSSTVGGVTTTGDTENTSVRAAGLGLGLTYYFMPINLYAAAAVGVGVGSEKITGSDFVIEVNTDPGFAMNLMLGKEWWISRRWGLGVAAQFTFMSLPPDSGNGANVNAYQIGVSFSATMN